jgi:transketolase
MALAAKHKNQSWRTYCILGDGELQEGSVWEAAMSAAHHQLHGLTAIVDRNAVQIDGKTSEVMEVEPLTDKWEAFGWKVIRCNGNDIESIMGAFGEAKTATQKPTVIIAKTLMGKGVKEIENDYRWHGKPVAKEQVEPFIKALKHDA